MSIFLKGSQQQFIFSLTDTLELLKKIFERDFVLFEDYVTSEEEKSAIIDIEKFKQILNKERYVKFNAVPNLFILPKQFVNKLIWEVITLKNGGLKYRIEPLKSHATQLLPSPQNDVRIGVGRISVCKEWQDDRGEIRKASFELDVFKEIKKLINDLSIGKIGVILVGKNAYKLWSAGKIQLAYDLNNPEIYEIKDFKYLRDKKSY